MKKFLLFFLIAVSFAFTANAQSLCGFDIKMAELKKQNPEYALRFAETERFVQNYVSTHLQSASKPAATISIPVVVHVMHTGGAIGSIYNPSDAQIIGAINYLNQVYAGTYAGMQAPVEGGGVVNMELKFVLAQRTPTCGSTNGIDRVDATGIPNYVSNGVNIQNTTGCTDLQLKNYARWNTADYYNIWVVNKIDGKDGTTGQFIAGYAAFAGSPASVDGTVMLATQMLSGESTLPHEIGHAFNLYHTFQGSNLNTSCPVNGTCSTDGDGVCDTDPVSNNVNGSGVYDFSCRTGTNTCTSGNFTRNTESNFMAYTSCYTLFTNGQKARVQAALNLPERMSLTTSLGAIPCGTVLNFNVVADSKTEDKTGTVSGCRTYKDYTYEVNVGEGPSALATVTLAYSGTATNGLDYDVTTNGSFTSPSNILTFAEASTAPQPFTVRVYDDANVEAPETAILNFSVTTSGNATVGALAPTFTLTINENDAAPTGNNTNTFQVGSISYTINNPFLAANGKQKGQILYKASELLAAGLTAGSISSMQWFVDTKNTTGSFNGFSIKLGTSPADYLYDGSASLGSGFTTVYNNLSLNTTAGWNNFIFSTQYVWDGFSNIVVEYCYKGVSGTGTDVTGGYSDGGTATQYNYIFQTGIDCSGSYSSISAYNTGVKPIVKFGLIAPGTDVETSTSGTHTEYLAPGSNDYYYSSANKIIAKIGNVNATLGCVQGSIENAGTAWQPFLTAYRSAKVFAVTPTTNGSTTNYTISLYFTAAELDGRLPAILKIAKTSAASIDLADAENTEFITPVITMLGTNVVFTANFTGFSRFFLVEDIVLLPVSVLSFNGELNDLSEADLHWKVSQQRGFNSFEVERSTDGTTFTSIGKVAATQGSSSNYDYNFTDKSIRRGLNYYRLKMIDNDGQFKYSQVIKIVNNGMGHFITLMGNPVTEFIGLSVDNSNRGILTAVLYNAVGARVTAWQIGARTGNIKLPIAQYNMASGIYLLKVSDGDKTTILKVVKK